MTLKDSMPSVKDSCLFLSDYAAVLCGCGATCVRLEKNVYRMAEALGIKVDMSIMPSHITMTGWNMSEDESFSLVRTIRHAAISFDMNTQLSKLS